MKKFIKLFSIVIITLFLSACKLDDLEVITVPENEDVSAIIYHSVMMGIDAGYEYVYYIYKDKEDYLFFKYQSNITIVGSSEEEFKKSGRLKSKEDFSIIEKDIESDNIDDTETYVSYDYYDNKVRNRFSTMEELLEKLYE